MKQRYERILFHAKQLLPCLACIFLLLLIIKQLALDTWLAAIYRSFLPILSGVLLAFFLQPIIDRVQQKFSLKVSVMLVYIGLLAILGAFLAVLLPLLYQQALELAQLVPRWLQQLEGFLKQHHIAYDNLNTLKQNYMQEGYIIAIDSAKSVIDTLTDYGIAYIIAFFISIDMDFWKRTAKKIVPNVTRVATFYHTLSNIIYQYLAGTMLDLLFIIVSVGIVLSLYRFPNALLYAMILALLNLFPYVGATLGLILIAAVAALHYDHYPWMMFFIVWSIQQIESNIIQPLIFNRTMNVRPLLTFVFIFISDAFFGVIGVILSPIFAAVAQIVFRSYLHSKTSDKVGEWEDIWRDFDEVMAEETIQ